MFCFDLKPLGLGPEFVVAVTETNGPTTPALVAAALHFSPERVALTKQVHETRVFRIDEDHPKKPEGEGADGLMTRLSGVLLRTLGADCLLAVLMDPVTGAIANIHAGWRGLDLGILAVGVKQLCEEGVDPGNVRVVLGPCCSVCCYEVGPEFKTKPALCKFLVEKEGGRLHLDMRRAASAQLESAGIQSENFLDVAAQLGTTCTCCDTGRRFASIRRDGPTAPARHALFVGRR